MPLCSSPLVQAKMLAMGLVLVGFPYKGTQIEINYLKVQDPALQCNLGPYPLVFTVVSGDSAVGSLGLYSLAIRAH